MVVGRFERDIPRAAGQIAEKLGGNSSGAKGPTGKEGFIAALEALHHPKSSLSASCEAGI